MIYLAKYNLPTSLVRIIILLKAGFLSNQILV